MQKETDGFLGGDFEVCDEGACGSCLHALRRAARLAILVSALLGSRASATDVAFWTEYRPDKDDAAKTYLLFQCNATPHAIPAGPVVSVETVGQPTAAEGGRFGKALRLDGRSALRCVMTNVFDGGKVSLEAWVRLERYPEKEGCIVFRRAVVDQNAAYDPKVDLSKGFALAVDAQGALHLDTVNTFYGKRTRTSTGPGAVPLGRWVHLAGVSAGARRLFVDGREVVNKSINWGEGLTVQSEKEIQPQMVYVGNNDQGDAGLVGLVDQVRVHRNVFKFWAPEDESWTDPKSARPVPAGPPCFVSEHAPVAVAALDGDSACTGSAGAKVELRDGEFRPGVRGQGYAGRVSLTASNLFRSEEGSLEFWLKPVGINNLSDKNRGFLGEPFIFYLFNGGEQEPTLYFSVKDGGLQFVHAPMEIHPAHWYHFVLTWRDQDIRIYADGKLAGRTTSQRLAPSGRASANRFVFDGRNLIDEVRIYDRALLPVEAANAFWRYRDPAKLVEGVRLPSVEFAGEYLPSRKLIRYQLRPFGSTSDFAELRLELRTQGKALKTWKQPWTGQLAGELELPALRDGAHTIATVVTTKRGEAVAGEDFEFLHRVFPWENNTLGLTDEVFPPFTPVQVRGPQIGVVSRTMTMNGFGLWDEVTALGHPLLAAPMVIRFETAGGVGTWKKSGGKFVEQQPKRAVFAASAEADAVKLSARSTMEIDGCMRVELTLAPGAKPAEIKKLWIEIPLRDAEVPLMHTIGDGLRHNFSGATPAGQGTVWDGTKVARTERWRNAFVPYVWLGGAERGLAFFAENDKGWFTEKNKSKTPTHELIREGERLTLRVYLINQPVTITAPSELVFGLQASPTKPMPADWRKKLPHAPGGLAVVPFGGIQCASQGPFADDWSIVEKVLEPRRGLPFDHAWASNYVAQFHPPKVHNESDWTYYLNHFAQRAKDVGPNRPLAVYQEEMRAAHSRPEWIVFQDEWKTTDGPAPRTSPDGLDLRGGHRSFCGISEINFTRSYADFGTWMAREWLQRGVSLYWDNTYLYPSYNTRGTAAYRTEDGEIQPALTIWNVRDYHQRVWHVLQQCRRNRPEPLEWTLHMTNTEMLPVHTWGTVQLDHELAVKHPFTPEWLRTETIGRQVGNLPLSLYEVYGRDNELIKKLPKAQAERIEWGLRAVHEIQRSGPPEKVLTSFGYGEDAVTVHNYWADQPVLQVTPASMKWLALAKPATGEMLLVLTSWSEEPANAEVRVDFKAAGLASPGLRVLDAETGETLAASATEPFSVKLSAPLGNRILRLAR